MTKENTNKQTKKATWWITGAVLIAALLAALLLGSLTRSPLLGFAGAKQGTEFSLTVTLDGSETVLDETLTANEGETLIGVMTRCIDRDGGVIWSSGEYGAYITAICGHEEDPAAGKYWTYTVNGEYGTVGASEYVPAEGDEIVFDLSAMEW